MISVNIRNYNIILQKLKLFHFFILSGKNSDKLTDILQINKRIRVTHRIRLLFGIIIDKYFVTY